MTLTTLLQTTPTQRLEALQQRFSRGGTWGELVLPLVGVAALFALLSLLYSLQKRRQRADIDHPGKLYRRLVQRLGLSAPQRDLLYRMAADLRLPNPSVVLLGRRIFDTHAQRWLATGRATRPDSPQRIAELADSLFPGQPASDQGAATSAMAISDPALPSPG
jgi:hypothetical protein